MCPELTCRLGVVRPQRPVRFAPRRCDSALANRGPRTRLPTLVRLIRARWSCEQAHEQLKNELGLDHFEGRSWTGLHRHVHLSMIAFCLLQYLRLGGKNREDAPEQNGTTAESLFTSGTPDPIGNAAHVGGRCARTVSVRYAVRPASNLTK